MSASPPSVLGLTPAAGCIRYCNRARHRLPLHRLVCTRLQLDLIGLWLLPSAWYRLRSAHADSLAAAGEAQAGEAPDLTPETVNAALDEVRPYLIADGGNVEVASVDEGVVFLRLQASRPHPRPFGARIRQGCLTALSACDLLQCLHGPLMLQTSPSGCSVSRCCCSQKQVACSLCAARGHAVPCPASMSEAICARAGRLRDLPLLGRHHEDGHRARAAGKPLLTAPLPL